MGVEGPVAVGGGWAETALWADSRVAPARLDTFQDETGAEGSQGHPGVLTAGTLWARL